MTRRKGNVLYVKFPRPGRPGVPVGVGETKVLPFRGRTANEAKAMNKKFAHEARDRLAHFLDMIDSCSVHYLGHFRRDDRLVFSVCARRPENLPLIYDEIIGERVLLELLGITSRDVVLMDGGKKMASHHIRISLPPSVSGTFGAKKEGRDA